MGRSLDRLALAVTNLKTFTDTAGRSWELAVNVSAIKRVRGLLGVDLLTVIEGELLNRLASDPILLADVLYALCKPQADAVGVSDEKFGAALAGDAIGAATEALLAELTDFFPQPRKGLLLKAHAKLTSLHTVAATEIGARLDSPELEDLLRRQIANVSSGNSPASATSTPTT